MPTAHDRQRITRQWTILLLLVRHRYGLTLARLREHTGASRITIWRDLRVLENAGVPLEVHPTNGERRIDLRTTDLPALILTPLHVQALELSRRLLGPLQGTALLDAYDDILLRVGRPVRLAPASEAESRAVAVRQALEQALARHVRARIVLLKIGQASAMPREIEPIGWGFIRNELYLLASDVERGARRSFASGRIRSVEVLDTPATRPAEEAGGDPLFAAPDGLESLPTHSVEVHLSAVAAAHLASRTLSASQIEHPQPDGTLRLTAEMAGLWSTAEWVVSWAPEARAVAPDALVEMVRSRLASGRAREATEGSDRRAA